MKNESTSTSRDCAWTDGAPQRVNSGQVETRHDARDRFDAFPRPPLPSFSQTPTLFPISAISTTPSSSRRSRMAEIREQSGYEEQNAIEDLIQDAPEKAEGEYTRIRCSRIRGSVPSICAHTTPVAEQPPKKRARKSRSDGTGSPGTDAVAKGKGKRRRTAGSLSEMMNMPLDVFLEVRSVCLCIHYVQQSQCSARSQHTFTLSTCSTWRAHPSRFVPLCLHRAPELHGSLPLRVWIAFRRVHRI